VSWVPDGVVTSLGLKLETGVPVRLRGRLDKTAFLTLGNAIEIVLAREHVEASRSAPATQTATALGDMAQVEAAERLVFDTFDAGTQARTAAERALAQVAAAERAGATEQAEWARRAARAAIEAADQAERAVRVAGVAMDSAEEAAEEAARAADAARAAGGIAGKSEQPALT
jgi:dTMP kinase